MIWAQSQSDKGVSVNFIVEMYELNGYINIIFTKIAKFEPESLKSGIGGSRIGRR